eukprot:m.300660 g.300660  ORF g.300660 m.300660 type:complete len:1171 (+) comp16422_c0_seq10:196-3708(+)
MGGPADTKVKVAVRVRPFNRRERDMGESSVVTMHDTQTILSGTMTKDGKDKIFNFDHSIWSHDAGDPHFQNQDQVFQALGSDVLDNVFSGYNACIFAYGQTGSGKTYTMMGAKDDDGLTPRLCKQLFSRINDLSRDTAKKDMNTTYSVEVSYFEIYNEKVKDLISVKESQHTLRVREHKILGPYVEGLQTLAVPNYEAIELLLAKGNARRTTAATAMNDTSSRSHAVFTMVSTEQWYDKATKRKAEKVSRLSLVDLAGSERVAKTGASGDRLKEGANINKSLSTLGLVIKALADNSSSKRKGGHVPYRDSVLTWLLKDSLGGNSKTVMIATISPAGDNFDETLSTLRYADSAKRIVNHAVVNEDPNARMIRELREELEALRAQVGSDVRPSSVDDEEYNSMQKKLQETESLMANMEMTWEEKLAQSNQVIEKHRKVLSEHGAELKDEAGALKLQSTLPHLVSIPNGFDTAIHIYSIKEGMTRVGTSEADDPPQDIIFEDEGMDPEQCIIEHEAVLDEQSGSLKEVVSIHPIGEHCYVNEVMLMDSEALNHGDIIQFGLTHLLRFNHPTEAQKLKILGKSVPLRNARLASAAQEEEEQARLQKERERQEEEVRMAEILRKQQEAEEKLQQEQQKALKIAMEEAERTRQKELENEKLRRDLEEMKLAAAREHQARLEKDELKQKEIEDKRKKDLELTAALNAAEERKLAELEALRQAEREEMEREREEIEKERRKLSELKAKTAEEQRIAEEKRKEAERLAHEREIELEKERVQQEKVRLHHIKMAQMEEEIQSRKRQAELRALEKSSPMQQRREFGVSEVRGEEPRKEVSGEQNHIPDSANPTTKTKISPEAVSSAHSNMNDAYNPFGEGQAQKAADGFQQPPTSSDPQQYQDMPGAKHVLKPDATGPRTTAASPESLEQQEEILRRKMLEYANRQKMPEVKNALKPDATDRKIQDFRRAKEEYVRKQQSRAAAATASKESMAMDSSNPFAEPEPIPNKPEIVPKEQVRKIEADEVIPDNVAPDSFIKDREQQQANDRDFQGFQQQWLMEQWTQLQTQPWFRGFATRDAAIKELKRKDPGCFIVRVSESEPGHYAISVRQAERVEHFLILPTYAGDKSVSGSTRYRLGKNSRLLFNSVPKLIGFYIGHPLVTPSGERFTLVGDIVMNDDEL